MFSLRFTIILLLILFIPFCLRALLSIEPYPAVLLPSGGGSIKKTGDSIVLNYKKLSALNDKGKWIKINPARLLYPIPIQYLPNVLSDNFGLDVDPSIERSKGFKLLKMLHLASKKPKSDEEIRESKEWVKKKLTDQHLDPSKIKITSFTQTISIPAGAVLDNKIKYERTISLDE